MMPVRPSIMNRRLREANPRNLETSWWSLDIRSGYKNVDVEFKNQLTHLYKKQERWEHNKEHVRLVVSPKREDKIRLQAEMKQAMEDQILRKVKDTEQAELDEQKLFCYNEYCRRFVTPHCIEATIDRMQSRRDYLKQLMEENKKSERMKKELQQREKEMEIEADHIRATTPCTWNRRHYL